MSPRGFAWGGVVCEIQLSAQTREFAVLRSRSSDHTLTMVSDIYRLWLLNTVGGIYLDADAFALQPTLYSRCPFVLNVVRRGVRLVPFHEQVSRQDTPIVGPLTQD